MTKLVLSRGGTVMIMVCDREIDLDSLNKILPEPVILTDRQASSFVHGAENALMAPFSLKEFFLLGRIRNHI